MIKYHIPVLLEESINALKIKDNGIYIDATFGGGGHSAAILKTNPSIRLFAFDQDKDTSENAAILQKEFPDRFKLIHDNFVNLWTRISLEKIKKIDGIIFDLGISSHQINSANRGFSFSLEGDLDMRMNQNSNLTAMTIINDYSYEKLKTIFFKYGEERESARIAKGIVNERAKKQIRTTLELAEIIDQNTFSRYKLKTKARIFQALRIYINGELEFLETALDHAVRILNVGGRIVVISYHSLEDRIVKNFFREQEKECICPPNFPNCICEKRSLLRVLSKKPVLPSDVEIDQNSRAHSAKLRYAEKKEAA